jgi:L-ribulose-5-phosphate 3-epimerase
MLLESCKDYSGIKMRDFKIGVIIDCFQLGLRKGIEAAVKVGAQGIQFYGNTKEITPETFGKEERRELSAFIAERGLEVSAICGDIGNFMEPSRNAERIKRAKLMVDMALDFGTKVVTTHIGAVPSRTSDPLYAVLQNVCRELGSYAADNGVMFAIETGPETAVVLREFLDSLKSGGMGVNLDPANLVMVPKDDPVAAVDILAPYIVHTHAKDGVNIKDCDPAEVYAAFDDGSYPDLEKVLGGAPFKELILGEGDVPWEEYLNALTAIGYNGYLTIEREEGTDRYGDISKGVEFLKARIN